MQAFQTVLRHDLQQLALSWVSRIWIFLLVGGAVFLTIVADSESEIASETINTYIVFLLVPVSVVAIVILASSTISGESSIIADSILSRSVTRTEYVTAKIISRIGFTLAVFLIAVVPFTYLMLRFAVNDLSLPNLLVTWFALASFFVLIAAIAIFCSVALPTLLTALMVVPTTVVLASMILQFIEIPWLTPQHIVLHIPEAIRGDASAVNFLPATTIYLLLSLIAITRAVAIFRHKDL